MKKFSDLPSTVFMVIGFVLGAIAVLLMFSPAIELMNQISGTSGHMVFNSVQLFWNEAAEGARSRDLTTITLANGAWPSFMGYMFILAGALLMGIMALPFVQPSAQGEKVVLGLSALLLIAGAILVLTIGSQFYSANSDLAKYSWTLKLQGGAIVAGIFAILAAGCDALSMYLDW